MRKRALLFLLLSVGITTARAQTDSLMAMLDNDGPKAQECVTATFKATRLINGSTVENLAQGTLDFRISHRFGRLDQGVDNFFGLDNATTRLGLDYGITNWLMVGLGHSTLNKENDGFLKLRLLRQRTKGMPITLSYFGAMSVQTQPAPTIPAGTEWFYSNRLAYTNQLLIARKVNDRLSLQLVPSLVHYNLVDSSKFSNNTFAIGVGGRVKVTRSIAITAEYYYRVTNQDLLFYGLKTYNSFSIGADIETGGHVFQLMFTNAQGITERAFIGQTTEDWGIGAIHFGFNISRVFTVVRPKEFKGSGKNW
jgi:opacity protein-like surface antigen